MGISTGDIIFAEEFTNDSIPRESVMKHWMRNMSKDLNQR